MLFEGRCREKKSPIKIREKVRAGHVGDECLGCAPAVGPRKTSAIKAARMSVGEGASSWMVVEGQPTMWPVF